MEYKIGSISSGVYKVQETFTARRDGINSQLKDMFIRATTFF